MSSGDITPKIKTNICLIADSYALHIIMHWKQPVVAERDLGNTKPTYVQYQNFSLYLDIIIVFHKRTHNIISLKHTLPHSFILWNNVQFFAGIIWNKIIFIFDKIAKSRNFWLEYFRFVLNRTRGDFPTDFKNGAVKLSNWKFIKIIRHLIRCVS